MNLWRLILLSLVVVSCARPISDMLAVQKEAKPVKPLIKRIVQSKWFQIGVGAAVLAAIAGTGSYYLIRWHRNSKHSEKNSPKKAMATVEYAAQPQQATMRALITPSLRYNVQIADNLQCDLSIYRKVSGRLIYDLLDRNVKFAFYHIQPDLCKNEIRGYPIYKYSPNLFGPGREGYDRYKTTWHHVFIQIWRDHNSFDDLYSLPPRVRERHLLSAKWDFIFESRWEAAQFKTRIEQQYNSDDIIVTCLDNVPDMRMICMHASGNSTYHTVQNS